MATPIEITRDEARLLGIYLSDSAADRVLWDFTWFPREREGSQEEQIRRYVREALSQNLDAWRTLYPPPGASNVPEAV